MEPEAHSRAGNSQPRRDPATENAGIGTEDAGLSQNGGGDTPTGPLPTPEPTGWEELQWSLFGLGPDGEQLTSEEKISYEEIFKRDISEDLSSLVGELDSDTRSALQEIDTYASASALAQERAALMGRAEDLKMDLRDMQEQIHEMERAGAGLRSAFREVYRRPEEALRVWDRLEGWTRSAGSGSLGKVSQILAASPERLGALRGASAFGFSTPARSQAVRATARAAGLVRAYQDAARRATQLGAFGGEDGAGENFLNQGVLEKSLSVEKGERRAEGPGREDAYAPRHRLEKKRRRSDEKRIGWYPGLTRKREEIEATRREAGVLAEKVRALTGGRPISEQRRVVTERVRSLGLEQRQALRKVILGAGAQSVDGTEAGRGMGSRVIRGREAVSRRTALEKKPAVRRNATARSTISRGQSPKKTRSKAGAMKGLLKASLRHVAIHVAIRTLDRVEKEARGREMLEM